MAFHLPHGHFCPCACHNLTKRPLRYGSGVACCGCGSGVACCRLGLLVKLWQAQAPSSRKAAFLGFYFELAAPRATIRQLAAARRVRASRAIAPARRANRWPPASPLACLPLPLFFFPGWRLSPLCGRAHAVGTNQQRPTAPTHFRVLIGSINRPLRCIWHFTCRLCIFAPVPAII